MGSHKYRRLLLKALKIAAGSGMAIIAAELLGLSYATSAGIITLLTVQDLSLIHIWCCYRDRDERSKTSYGRCTGSYQSSS